MKNILKKNIYHTLLLSLSFVFLLGFTLKADANVTISESLDLPYEVTGSDTLPVANAGIDRQITLPTVTLTIPVGGATATDAEGVSQVRWTLATGASVVITNDSTLTPTFDFIPNLTGDYVMRLTVTDTDGNTAYDDMTVTVNPVGTNILPVANAGPDQSITLPTSAVSLAGSGSDADGTIAFYQWTTLNPGVTIVSPSSPSTSVTGMTAVGVYTFNLRVTDNQGDSGSDSMTVTVNSAVSAVPVVSITASPTSGTVNVVNPALTWGATNSPTSCSASGDWSGAQATSGNTVYQGVLTSVRTYTYRIVCSNADGDSAPASATVVVNNASVVNGQCSSPEVHYGCASGTPDPETQIGTDPWKWSCLGSGGGSDASCSEPFTSDKQCEDKSDNDGDGFVDELDPGCHTDGNPANPLTYDPLDDREKNIKIEVHEN